MEDIEADTVLEELVWAAERKLRTINEAIYMKREELRALTVKRNSHLSYLESIRSAMRAVDDPVPTQKTRRLETV